MSGQELAWAETDLSAIAHNVRQLRKITSPQARFMAVVKANAYGHGAVEVAKTALRSGADWLGAARMEEGIALRKAGLDAPILIFGYTPPSAGKDIARWDLTQTVYSAESARIFSQTARSAGKKIRIHIKTDTGMGRLGLLTFPKENAEQSVREIKEILRLPGLEPEGIFTHFAASDAGDKSYAHLQMQRFSDFLDRLGREGITFPLRHAANSAAIMDLPESHLDLVRAGIAMYGLRPSDEVAGEHLPLKPAMTLKCRIIHLKKADTGFCVSYGMTHRTQAPTVIATVSIGYADGYSRLLSNKGSMLVHGTRARIAGRVCMDLTMLDTGHIPDTALGDEVVVFGKQGHSTLPAEELAALTGTINYEIVSSLTSRVQRICKPDQVYSDGFSATKDTDTAQRSQ
ncbi:MAG: alanine racemase [Desulfobacterales bacterium]